jgi:hypothetical protein
LPTWKARPERGRGPRGCVQGHGWYPDPSGNSRIGGPTEDAKVQAERPRTQVEPRSQTNGYGGSSDTEDQHNTAEGLGAREPGRNGGRPDGGNTATDPREQPGDRASSAREPRWDDRDRTGGENRRPGPGEDTVPGSGFLGLGAPKGRKILREEGRGRESANVRRPRATVRIVSEVLEGECKVKGGTPTTLETAGPATWWNTPRSRPRGQGRRRGRQAEITATSGRQTPKISTTPRRARVEGPGKQRRETGRWQHRNGPERATRRTETRHTRFEILRKETRGLR